MRAPLAWVVLLLPGCTAGSRGLPPAPVPASEGRRERDDAIVALFNGEPLTWRTVAERMMESDPRTAVETYARWRIIEDRKRELGVAPTPEERRRRAESHVAGVRRSLPEAEFRSRLASEGLDEAGYVRRLADSDWMRHLLALDLIVRYQAMTDGTMTIDRAAFAEEAEARRFAARCREQGFEAAAAELEAGKRAGARRLPRETFARSAPPADPVLDAWIVEALEGLKPGEATDVESSRSDLKYVVRLVEKRPGQARPFPEVRAELLEGVLKEPPSAVEIRAWIASRLERARLEYPAPGARGRGR